MNGYSSFDYLCNEPFLINGIGSIRCPTLRDIRRLTYLQFCFYLNMLSASTEDSAKLCVPETESCNHQEGNTKSLYGLLLYENPQLLLGILHFFLSDSIEFDRDTSSFLTFSQDREGNKHFNGHIGSDNFNLFCDAVLCIMGIQKPEDRELKFKNKHAAKLYEKLKNNPLSKKKKQDADYSLDNMVRKFCTHNKSGINILNVWDMTYYQFISMFGEYQNARQCDFNDMMAANTFSYKKSSDYKPLDYMRNTDA